MSDPVRFWINLVSSVSSIICSLFVLYHLLLDRILRRALHNHIIIVLLFIGVIRGVTRLPSGIHQFFFGRPLIQTSSFYLFSFIVDYPLYTTQIILVVWASIERHILIFHVKWVSTRKKRFIVHYLPIIAVVMYCFVYYVVITFGPFCQHSFDGYLTGGVFIPCVYTITMLGMWDLLAHQCIPNLIISSFSIALIVRVINQKRKLNQPMQWRKHRKMAIQLLSISVVYVICNSPWAILMVAIQYGLPMSTAKVPLNYILLLRNHVIYLFPFICCASLPNLQNKLRQIFFCCQQQRYRVAP